MKDYLEFNDRIAAEMWQEEEEFWMIEQYKDDLLFY